MKNIFNILGFNFAWWGCVIGTSKGYPYLGPILMFIFLLIHCSLFIRGTKEIYFILIILIFGTCIDSILAYFQILKYYGTYIENIYIAPLWISSMWAGFAATVNHSMLKLKQFPFLLIIMGAIFGPLAYITGLKFSVIDFNFSMTNTVAILSFIWSFSMYFIFKISEIINA